MSDAVTAEPQPRLAAVSGVVAVVVAAALAGLVAAGPIAVGIGVLAFGLVLALGWPGTADLPGTWGIREVVAFGAVLVGVSVIRSDDLGRPHWLALALAAGLLAAFLAQLMRSDGRADVVGALSCCALGLAILACGALEGFAAARPHAGAVAWTVVIGIAASVLVRGVLQRTDLDVEWAVPVAMAIGAGGGAAVAAMTGLPWNRLLLVGLLAAGLGHVVRAVVSGIAVRSLAARVAVGVAVAFGGGVLVYAATWWLNR